MNHIRRIATALVLATALGATASACSSDPPVTYAPAAYGEAGHCYYVDSPDEANALLAAGLCPTGWVAYPAPLAWQETYWGWYSSPSYYNTYIPVSRRTTYTSVTVVHFSSSHASDITRLSSTATYKGSNGKTVTGPATAKMKFSSGSGSKSSQGGGSLRNGTTGGTTGGGSKSTSGGTTGGSKSTSGGTSGGSLRGGHK